MYYSEITCDRITEIEAHMQILALCERWHNLAYPNGDFIKYLKKHTNLLNIEQWPCFIKIKEYNL